MNCKILFFFFRKRLCRFLKKRTRFYNSFSTPFSTIFQWRIPFILYYIYMIVFEVGKLNVHSIIIQSFASRMSTRFNPKLSNVRCLFFLESKNNILHSIFYFTLTHSSFPQKSEQEFPFSTPYLTLVVAALELWSKQEIN